MPMALGLDFKFTFTTFLPSLLHLIVFYCHIIDGSQIRFQIKIHRRFCSNCLKKWLLISPEFINTYLLQVQCTKKRTAGFIYCEQPKQSIL